MSFVLLPYVVQLLYHITRSRLCQQLFYFFKLFVSTLFRFHATALICYHTLKSLSTLFTVFLHHRFQKEQQAEKEGCEPSRRY